MECYKINDIFKTDSGAGLSYSNYYLNKYIVEWSHIYYVIWKDEISWAHGFAKSVLLIPIIFD